MKSFTELQQIACAAIENDDLDTWINAAEAIYRHCGGNPEPGWDCALLWDGTRPWDGWHTWTEEELKKYVEELTMLPKWAQGIGLPKGPGVPADPALFVSVVRAIDAAKYETYWLKAKSIIFLYMQDVSITPAVAAKILSFLAEKTGVVKRIQTPRGAQFAIVPQNKCSEKA